jgi:subtilisin family serine protease
LQLSLGTAGAALLPVGTTAAESGDGVFVDESLSSGSGPTDVIVSLDTTSLEEISVDVQSNPESARTEVLQSQEPVKTTLDATAGVDIHRQFWVGNAILARVDTGQVDVQTDIAGLDGVSAVYENEQVDPPEPVERKPTEVGSEPQQSDGQPTYGLEQINALSAAAEFGATGDGATVAVLDTGIDADHPAHADFDADNFAEFTLMGDQVATDPTDPDAHGTHVSGTVAGEPAEDTEGVKREIGVAPDVELLSGKVFSRFDGQTSGATAQIVAGMEWAVENGADVINMSLGTGLDGESEFGAFYLEAIRDVVNAGVLPVASSGNNGQGLTGSPGNILETFSIAANDNELGLADFSSGEQVYAEEAWGFNKPDDYPEWYTVPDVSGPGVDVLSSVPSNDYSEGGSYAEFSGTSMSSPHVAGSVANILSDGAVSDPLEVRSLLEETAVHPNGPGNEDTEFGVGVIDLLGALASANGGGAVTGTVTTGSDDSPVDIEVTSDFGTRSFTNENGEYELYLPSGESELQLDKFGFTATSTTVDVPADGTVEQDIALDPELALSLLSLGQPPVGVAQPPELTRGESFTITLEVANLEEFTVELADQADGFEQGDVTFALGETEFGLGETLPLGVYSGPVQLTVNIALGSEAAAYANENNIVDIDGFRQAINDLTNDEISVSVFQSVLDAFVSGDPVQGSGGDGTLALDHTFVGLGEEVTVTTGPTDVTDGQPATFEITDSVLPEETGGEKDADDNPDTVTVGAVIENTGDVQATKQVTYEILGIPFPQYLTIGAGETAQFTSSISNLVAAGFGGTETQHAIVTPDDSVSGTLFINEGTGGGGADGEILVDSIDAPESVTVGETINVTATIENTRSEDYSTLVQYQFDARASSDDSIEFPSFQAVDVPAGSKAVVTFSLETDGLLAGEYSHGVLTANDSATAPIVVEEATQASGEPAGADD